MALNFVDRLQHAWRAFTSRDPTYGYSDYGGYTRLDKRWSLLAGDRSIVTMIVNRIAVDCAQVNIRHVKRDDNGFFEKEVDSRLNKALSVNANIDQTGRAFIQDLVQSMLDEGVVAAVPIGIDIATDGKLEFESLRVGEIVAWYPEAVRLLVYNEEVGRRQEMIAYKKNIAIIENPFHAIMNEENSTLKRLLKTLNNLDLLNEQNVSGKLDLIIQNPYQLRTEYERQQAKKTQKQIERDLTESKYGIAFLDASSRVTQLNRPVDNNLWTEAQDLTNMLFNQLGLTQSVFDGTATVTTMNNYYNRTIEPILTAVVEEMERKFLTKTARTQHQAVIYIRDPFKLVGVTDIAEMAKVFTANEIMTSNEVRSKIGLKPVEDSRANELINKNINKVGEEAARDENEAIVQNEQEKGLKDE